MHDVVIILSIQSCVLYSSQPASHPRSKHTKHSPGGLGGGGGGGDKEVNCQYKVTTD